MIASPERASLTSAAMVPAISLVLVTAIAGCGGSRHGTPSTAQQQAAATFLKNYVRPNGRVAPSLVTDPMLRGC